MPMPTSAMQFMMEMYLKKLLEQLGMPHEQGNISDIGNILTGQRESPDSVGWEPRGMEAMDYLAERMKVDPSRTGPSGQIGGGISDLLGMFGRTPVEAGVTKVVGDTTIPKGGDREITAIFKKHGLSQQHGIKEIIDYLPQYMAETSYKGQEVGFSERGEGISWLKTETMFWLRDALEEKGIEFPEETSCLERLGEDLELYMERHFKF